jgi:glutamate 5-kinase
VILTDVDGLYEKDPRFHPEAKLISKVKKITPSMMNVASENSGSKHGTGGMLSKVRAAKEAVRAKVQTVLVKGDSPSVLLRVAQDNFIGTVFEVK